MYRDNTTTLASPLDPAVSMDSADATNIEASIGKVATTQAVNQKPKSQLAFGIKVAELGKVYKKIFESEAVKRRMKQSATPPTQSAPLQTQMSGRYDSGPSNPRTSGSQENLQIQATDTQMQQTLEIAHEMSQESNLLTPVKLLQRLNILVAIGVLLFLLALILLPFAPPLVWGMLMLISTAQISAGVVLAKKGYI